MAELKPSWLVQRLERPLPTRDGKLGLSEVFAFGGGLHNGGLSETAMELLRPVFRFDYMGAAEYEFGAVPEALSKLAQTSNAGELVGDSFTLSMRDVAMPWMAPSDEVIPEDDDREVTVWLLCPRDARDEVERRVRSWAGQASESDLRDTTRLARTLRTADDPNSWSQTAGWLELTNGFMFFIDEQMWRGCCDVFGVEVGSSANANTL